MVELDVSDDRNRREVVKELGPFVEERRVVLVALDDEGVAASGAKAAGEIRGHAADQKPRVEAGAFQNPSGERRRGGLAVRPGDHHRRAASKEEVLEDLGHRDVRNPTLQDRFELRVPARERVSHHDQVHRRGQVGGGIGGAHFDSELGEKRRHRRITIIIRPRHLEPALLQQPGEGRHRRPRDAEEVNAERRGDDSNHATAPSSRVNPSASSRACAPSGSVSPFERVWPEGNPKSTGTFRYDVQSLSISCRV